RFDTPVRRRVVLVVERELVGIRPRGDVHPFVPQVQAVHARRQFGGCQMIHAFTYTVCSPAACMMARFTAVRAICTLYAFPLIGFASLTAASAATAAVSAVSGL